ncbi:TPA: flagellar basal body rod protein FlgB [Candidatus Poribacteria bacterium]|nr:flagellar basal body rod protein FlgB [Candidatus Poribacteria bacterium]
MNSLFDNTIQLLTKATSFTSLRHNVIANNIANVETPGYKAYELKFEHLLKQALDTSNEGFQFPHQNLRLTRKDNQPILVLDTTQQPRLDGNTVNPDRQMAKLAENTIMHNAFLKLLNMRFKILRTAINEKA